MVPRSLPRLRIAVACNADWNAMAGNDRARVCAQCCQTVYNVERLRPREVAALLERHGDRVPCFRLLERPDGTVVTRSCLTWVTNGVRRVRIGALSVAAMALGFWANVLLWRARLHPEPEALVPADATFSPPHLVPPPPPPPSNPFDRNRAKLLKEIERERNRYTMGAIPPPREPHKWDPPPKAQVTTQMIHAALEPHLAALQGGLKTSASGRADITVTVKPDGRVGRIRVGGPPELRARGEKLMRAAAKELRLPRNSEEYQIEFPLLFQGGE